MSDLWLKDLKPGDLTLQRDRLTGTDLWLTDLKAGDLRLTRPTDLVVDLHGILPPLQSQLSATAGYSNASLQATLPTIQSQLGANYGADAGLHATLTGVVSQMAAAYDNAVWRGIESQSCGVYQAGIDVLHQTRGEFQESSPIDADPRSLWTDGLPARKKYFATFSDMRKAVADVEAMFIPGFKSHAQVAGFWGEMRRDIRPRVDADFQSSAALAQTACMGWIDLLRTERPSMGVPHEAPVDLISSWCGDYQWASPHRLEFCWDWQSSVTVAGWGGRIIIPKAPPGPGVDPCTPIGIADLILRLFREPGVLILRPCLTPGPPPLVVVPILKVYIVANNVHLVRVSDSLELPCFSLSMAIDVDSWSWQFSAELPADQLTNVQPGASPVEVEAQVNTYTWRFLVEDIRRTRSFGRSRISISGRGLAANLDAPYAGIVNRSNSSDLGAQQILNDLLTNNGVPIGWTVDWQLTDWTVLAGAWSHAGTYMEGAKKIAEAAGAIVQADRIAQTLHILHRYPIAPWDWGAAVPSIAVPSAIVVTEGVQWVEKPPYNAAYVSGESLGILGHVTRTGTAGDIVAPMVTHPLVNHLEAARQRGIAILSDVGKQAIYTLSMPLDPGGTGLSLLEPTQFIEYDTGIRGLVRSTRIEARDATVRQTITLETHL